MSSPDRNPILQSLLLCAFGLVMLGLVLYQEVVMGQYWSNLFGFGTQMYFLPLLSIVSPVLSPVLMALMSVIHVWQLYIGVWLCMFLISAVGCVLKKRK